jgi:tetratricopeptide (TPR) repeat protein
MSINNTANSSGFNLFQKIIEKSLYLLTFLLPLFWFPFFSSPYEFGKNQLLLILSSVAFLAWAVKIILKDQKISFNLNLLDFSVLFFVLVNILSTIFSLDSYISLFGSYGVFSNGLSSVLALSVVYFLIRDITSENKEIVKKLLKVFFSSFSLVVIISLFSVLGLGQKLNIDNAAIQQKIFNPVSFSLEGLSVFIALGSVLLTGIITSSVFKKDKLLKILLALSVFLLLIIDIVPAWIVLLAGLSTFTIFGLIGRSFKSNIHQLLLPIFLVIIAILFILIDLGSASFLSFPQEQYLNYEFSYEVANGTIQEGNKNLLIGSGLGTWENDFLKNRSVKFNEESVLWQSRLSRAGNYIAELVATTGIVGSLSYLSLILFSLYGFFLLEEKKKALPYISGLIAVLASQFVYYQTSSLAFLGWFILGIGAIAWKDALGKKFAFQKTLSESKLPELNLGFSVLLILLSLAVIGGLFFSTKEALADYYYIKAQRVEDDLDTSISYLKKSINQNPYRVYYRNLLSQVYLNQAFEEYGKPAEEQNTMIIQGKINQILSQIEVLETDFGNHVSAWEIIGLVRRDIQGSTEGAIEAFKKALQLDPKNPTVYTEVGNLYAGLGDLDKARENYQKAQELKSNYYNAYLLEALSYEEDNPEKTIEELKVVEEKFPSMTETKYQLGRIYKDQGESDLAISYFIETLQLSPTHSNALYSLGLIYEEKGNFETALAAFERVAELNPENEQVQEKVSEIKEELGE